MFFGGNTSFVSKVYLVVKLLEILKRNSIILNLCDDFCQSAIILKVSFKLKIAIFLTRYTLD